MQLTPNTMVTVTVSSAGRVSRARGLPVTLSFEDKQPEEVTIRDVKAAVKAKFPKFYESRQKLSLKGERQALEDGTTLKDAGLFDTGELIVKDLGPQIGWKTVFLIEYVGPLIIHPLIYYNAPAFYGRNVLHSTVQKMVYCMVMLHFLKRELETIFVHRFSHGTMPFRNVFKNSAHYWLLSGLALAYAVYSPTYAETSSYVHTTARNYPEYRMGCLALWAYAELSNLITHLNLRSLRPAGTTKRAIPYGYGFALVSCPNYFFESVSWLAVALLTNSYVAWIFLAFSSSIMANWAIKKHKAYRREFGKDYPRGRKAIFPFIL
ncbi:uncharacterized protein LAESUDRAFT_742744 [Laetiporus sulphureus 93-53]|uniref:very-long-chain enoyl-CoA reductase n=1 Tax=Laetiporus sulphureus 93-53 TaxID=1314785 RepID=A0A165ERJ0_9APHY|nr:uncharacterized protein LAESUDRAFT_742744 [Laetiporus sulphureus 93-53]KZT07617.1 hypothetical protein LAESUDRAFT_742744 [Laetiporus sulphureus 93-53]